MQFRGIPRPAPDVPRRRPARVSRARGGAAAGACSAEALEPRALLSFGADGPEFRVNTHLPFNQMVRAAAADADGDFVVAWSSFGQDPSGGYDVYARRYDRAGVPRGGEFLVNPSAAGSQFDPAVAMDADGDFVVAWVDEGRDDESAGVFARRYDAGGVAQGDAFRVSPADVGASGPSVAMDDSGNFVVAWTGFRDAAAGGADVFARRYDRAGAARGGEFRVNTHTAGSQREPSAAMDADGDFLVAWTSQDQDGSGAGVYGRRFDAAGAARGDEFRVNTHTAYAQAAPSAAMDGDGDAVVVWTSQHQDGSGAGVFGQRFDGGGARAGGEFRVNTDTELDQIYPSATMTAGGEFVVAWNDWGLPGVKGPGVFARRYDRGGAPVGDEFLVNTDTDKRPGPLAAAVDDDGDLVVVWSAYDAGTGSREVYGQRYTAALPPAAVAGRRVLYLSSFARDRDDEGGVAPDKQALLPGQTGSFANYTTGPDGIDGVAVDLANRPAARAPGAGDFIFRVGDISDTTFWSTVRPQSVEFRRSGGAGGADRVYVTFRDGTALNSWLQVTVLPTDQTGLSAPDVFYFGNLAGDTGEGNGTASSRVNSVDLAALKRVLNTASTLSGRFDFNRDGTVNALDVAVLKRNLNKTLGMIVAAPLARVAAAAVSPSVPPPAGGTGKLVLEPEREEDAAVAAVGGPVSP